MVTPGCQSRSPDVVRDGDRGGEWGATGERSTKQRLRFTFRRTNREKFYDRPIKGPDNRERWNVHTRLLVYASRCFCLREIVIEAPLAR